MRFDAYPDFGRRIKLFPLNAGARRTPNLSARLRDASGLIARP